jgi:hypothetical protein
VVSVERRQLVPFEVAAVIAAAIVPLPVPAVLPLIVVASVSLWLRGRSFAAVTKGPALHAIVGTLAGLAALVLAVVIGTPLVERLTGGAVQWSMYPVVRGSGAQFVMVAILIAASAIAAELVLRGWIVDRVLELGGGNAMLAILVGAIAESLVTPGTLDARLGAGVFGMAMGWMFVGGGRSITAPVCARVAFSIGAIALEALRVVG